MENFNCIQIYSVNNDLNLLVDKIWVKDDRVYFRAIKELEHSYKHLRKEENDSKVYSIPADSFYSIRCRVYF
jgi:hypothetical protein